jgi:CubicO group peptidase (beta-lactamase class C family)
MLIIPVFLYLRPINITPKIYRNTHLPVKLIYLICFSGLACTFHDGINENKTPKISGKWDSLPSKLVNINACYAAFIDADGQVYEYSQGKNAHGTAVDASTIFEGASLSKTVFAYTWWKLLNKHLIDRNNIPLPVCTKHDITMVSPLDLLRHAVPCNDSCFDPFRYVDSFAYSEQGYLLLQKNLERQTGENLEQLAYTEVFREGNMEATSFLWHDSTLNFVNGFYENDKFHRQIYHLTTPASNGSLYIDGNNLVKFTKMLLNSPELDSMAQNPIMVPGFDHLSWGQGIGIEQNKGKQYLWQWGSNWSFNHILLINRTDKTAFICLSNSMIGAKRIMETSNWLFDTHFQLFDYTKWY